MKIERLHSKRITAAQLLLLCFPACFVGAYMLWHLNQYYTVLHNQWLQHTIYYSLGIVGGCIFYNYRFRFISTFLPLILVLNLFGGQLVIIMLRITICQK